MRESAQIVFLRKVSLRKTLPSRRDQSNTAQGLHYLELERRSDCTDVPSIPGHDRKKKCWQNASAH